MLYPLFFRICITVKSYLTKCMFTIQPFILIKNTFYKLIEVHQAMWNMKNSALLKLNTQTTNIIENNMILRKHQKVEYLCL